MAAGGAEVEQAKGGGQRVRRGSNVAEHCVAGLGWGAQATRGECEQRNRF